MFMAQSQSANDYTCEPVHVYSSCCSKLRSEDFLKVLVATCWYSSEPWHCLDTSSQPLVLNLTASFHPKSFVIWRELLVEKEDARPNSWLIMNSEWRCDECICYGVCDSLICWNHTGTSLPFVSAWCGIHEIQNRWKFCYKAFYRISQKIHNWM